MACAAAKRRLLPRQTYVLGPLLGIQRAQHLGHESTLVLARAGDDLAPGVGDRDTRRAPVARRMPTLGQARGFQLVDEARHGALVETEQGGQLADARLAGLAKQDEGM